MFDWNFKLVLTTVWKPYCYEKTKISDLLFAKSVMHYWYLYTYQSQRYFKNIFKQTTQILVIERLFRDLKMKITWINKKVLTWKLVRKQKFTLEFNLIRCPATKQIFNLEQAICYQCLKTLSHQIKQRAFYRTSQGTKNIEKKK